MRTGSSDVIGIVFDPPPRPQVEAVVKHVLNTVGTELPPHPGGWPGEIEKALLDAIFSARASYGSPGGEQRAPTGVYRVLKEWEGLRTGASRRPPPMDDLKTLRATVREVGFGRLHGINNQKVPGRQATRPTKWKAADETAGALMGSGVSCAADVAGRLQDRGAFDEMHRAFVTVSGVGDATFSYFLMLLGHPGVKADTMVRAFIDEALNTPADPGGGDLNGVSAKRAQGLLIAAAQQLKLDVLRLDHAVWNHQRDVRRQARE